MADPHSQLHPQERYWMALGRFLDDFAHVESMLQTLLWVKADTSEETARAVFSGVRIDGAKDFIRRIAESRGDQIDPVLTRAFGQLTVLTTLRNDVVHYGAPFDPRAGTWVATNSRIAMPGKARTTSVDPEALLNASLDLWTISYALSCFIRPDLRHAWDELAQAPWRYTYVQQDRRIQPLPSIDQERKPQP